MRGDQGRNQDDSDHRQGPEPGGDKTVQPSSNSSVNAEGTRLRRRLSKIFHRDSPESGFFWRRAAGAGNARQQPARNLPIPANPAVPAAHVRAVAGGIFLVQLHIAQQSRPRVAPFQKIVAEDPVLGEASVERPLERIDVIDPLADERAFTEQVLVNIGDGARIRVDARLAPAQPRIPRPVRARQAHGHARLKDAVPLTDTLLVFVVARTIQRVRHGSHKLPRRIARQLRIRVKGDHVLHVRQDCRLADDEREAIPEILSPPRRSEFKSASFPRLRS